MIYIGIGAICSHEEGMEGICHFTTTPFANVPAPFQPRLGPW